MANNWQHTDDDFTPQQLEDVLKWIEETKELFSSLEFNDSIHDNNDNKE